MKIKALNILSMIGVCAIVACNEDSNFYEVRKSSDLNVTLADTSRTSRVVVDDYGKNSQGETFSWESGDEIGIAFGSNATFEIFKTIGVKDGVAVFHKDEGVADSTYDVTYGIYPMSNASAISVTASSVSYKASVKSQTQFENTTDHVGDNLCMYAIKKNVNWYNQAWFSGANLEFNHLCAMIRYRIKNKSSYDIGIGNVSMTINQGGDFYTTETVVLNANGTNSITKGATTKTLTLTCTNCNVKSNENWDGYMVVLPCLSAEAITVTSSITVEDYTDDVNFIKSGRTTKYPLPQIFAGKTYYVSLTVTNAILPESVKESVSPALNFEFEGIEEY